MVQPAIVDRFEDLNDVAIRRHVDVSRRPAHGPGEGLRQRSYQAATCFRLERRIMPTQRNEAGSASKS
jgi:hypothetical protein